jgi:polysaccharide chain length determinant protein (PEP-CTERM system associated)
MPDNEAEGNLADTIARLFRTMIRRRWGILSSIVTADILTTALLLWLPNRYTSDATLVAVQQQVSARFVQPTATMEASEAFHSMVREILSHRQLLQIAGEFGLYGSAQQVGRPEAVVDAMRRNITAEPLDASRGDSTAFKISFTAESPRLAQGVTARLASLFIEQNQKTQAKVAASTTAFLTQQLEAKRQELAEQEQRMREFKVRHGSDLPDNQQGTLARLIDLRTQLQTTLANLSRVRQQQVLLESSLKRTVARMQSEKEALLVRFTAKHPQVIKKEQEISIIERLIQRLRTGSGEPNEQLTAPVPDDPALVQTMGQLEANALEVEGLSKDEQRLKATLGEYEGRLSRIPEKEQQLAAMEREYNLLAQDYTDLKGKLQQSELSADVARQQEGQQFRLIDPPTLPLAPSSPKRLKISIGGLAAGILLGFALAFLRDKIDTSFRSEKEIAAAFPTPIVVGVPFLLTPRDRRAQNWSKALDWVSVGVVLLVITAAELYVYMRV